MTPVAYREQIHDVLNESSQTVEARVKRVLAIGSEYLDLPIGFCTRIDADTQKIAHATGDHDLIQPGETCPLDEAYCRRTVEIASPLAVQDVSASGAIADSAVETFGLGAYIGARIVLKNETWGTICFADTEARDVSFSDAESYFVELAARLLGQLFERQSYELEIEEREREASTNEEVTRAVVDASFDLAFQVGPDGRFTYVSPTAEDLLGYPPEHFIGRSFTSILPNQETTATAEELYEAVMRGETLEREYFPLEHKDDDRVLVDVRVTPLYSGDVPPADRTPADITGVQGMARDARGRYTSQRIIQVLNRVLRHNLRNEVGVISGYAEMLQKRNADENAAYAGKIVEASDRLMTLSETARKLEANLDTSPETDSIDVVPIVARTAARTEERYPDATVSVTTPESAVAESAPRLETAMWELLENAAKHAGEGPNVAVSVRVDAAGVVIRVSDGGPGLPEQEREVLVSGTETPLVHGSGLGLWLVYWVVESLDARLTVPESEEGACIEIALKQARAA